MAIDPIFGTLAQGLGGVFGAIQNRKNVKDTIKAQRDAANIEWARNLEMWNRQNEWNLPKNQVQRMEDAGINPNLIAGNAGSFGQAGEIPKYQAPRPDYSGRESMIQKALGSLSAFNNIRLQNAQIDQVKQQTQNAQWDADLKMIQSKFLKTWEDDGKAMKFNRWFESLIQQREGQFQKSVQDARRSQIEADWLDMTKGTAKELFDWLQDGLFNRVKRKR